MDRQAGGPAAAGGRQDGGRGFHVALSEFTPSAVVAGFLFMVTLSVSSSQMRNSDRHPLSLIPIFSRSKHLLSRKGEGMHVASERQTRPRIAALAAVEGIFCDRILKEKRDERKRMAERKRRDFQRGIWVGRGPRREGATEIGGSISAKPRRSHIFTRFERGRRARR